MAYQQLCGLLCAALCIGGCAHGRHAAPSEETPSAHAVGGKFSHMAPELVRPVDAVVSASGLASKVLQPGKRLRHPQALDQVDLLYTCFRADGAAVRRVAVAPERHRVDQLPVPGLQEGVRWMVVGEKRRFWVPTALVQSGAAQLTDGPLIVDVELVGIVPGILARAAPEDVATPPSDGLQHPSGVVYRVLKEGHQSQQRPRPWDHVELHYDSWRPDGEPVATTRTDGKPDRVALADLIPGLVTVLQTMSAGDQVRAWIPERLTAPGAPAEADDDLVMDVVLLEVLPQPQP